MERDRHCQHDCLQWLTVCCEIENSQQTADVKGWIPRFHTRVIWCCKLRLWHAIRFQLKKTQQRDDWRKLDTILYVSRCRILWWGYWSDMRSVKPFIVPPATKKDGCVALCWLDYSLLQCHFNLHIYNKIIICILELENIITSALSCVPKTSMNKQCGRRVQPTWYALPPPVCNPYLWPFNLETAVWGTSKVETFIPNWACYSTTVLGLFTRIIYYICDGWTDRQMDRRMNKNNAYCPLPYGQGHKLKTVLRCIWVWSYPCSFKWLNAYKRVCVCGVNVLLSAYFLCLFVQLPCCQVPM